MQVHMVLPQATVAKDIGNYSSIEAEQRMKQTSYEGSQVDRVWQPGRKVKGSSSNLVTFHNRQILFVKTFGMW